MRTRRITRRNKKVLRPAQILNPKRNVNVKSRVRKTLTKGIRSVLNKKPTANVCIIRSVGGIGDILMITPSLRELKMRWPDARFTFAVERHRTGGDIYYSLVKNAPFIDDLIDARYVDREKFDRVADISSVCLPYENKKFPPVNRIDLFARHLGMNSLHDSLPFYKVEPEETEWAKEQISKNLDPNKPLLALHTASNDAQRTWALAEQLKMLKFLRSRIKDIQFLVFDWNKLYNKWSEFDNLLDASRVSVRQMAALINEVDIFVGPDSGPMHIAGALGIPSIVAFGAIPPQARINHYPSHTYVRAKDMSCLGCWYSRCGYGFKCMKEIKGAEVGEKVIYTLRGAHDV